MHYDALIVATGLSKSLNGVAGLEDPLLRDNRLRTMVHKYGTFIAKQRLRNPEDNPMKLIEERRSMESVTSAHFYDSSGDVQRVLTQNIDEFNKGKIVFALESSTNVAEPDILYSVSQKRPHPNLPAKIWFLFLFSQVIFMLHDTLKSMKVRHNHTIDLYFPGDKAPLLDMDMLGDKINLLLKQYKINLFPRHSLVSLNEVE